MFSHVMLGTLSVGPGIANHNGIVQRYFYRSPTGNFGITQPLNGEPATHGNGSTIGFKMESPEQADAFHAAGVANGGTTSEDPPGWRDNGVGALYRLPKKNGTIVLIAACAISISASDLFNS